MLGVAEISIGWNFHQFLFLQKKKLTILIILRHAKYIYVNKFNIFATTTSIFRVKNYEQLK